MELRGFWLVLRVCVYLSPKVLDVTACDKFFIKFQFGLFATSARHAYPALRYFLKRYCMTPTVSNSQHREIAETSGCSSLHLPHGWGSQGSPSHQLRGPSSCAPVESGPQTQPPPLLLLPRSAHTCTPLISISYIWQVPPRQ